MPADRLEDPFDGHRPTDGQRYRPGPGLLLASGDMVGAASYWWRQASAHASKKRLGLEWIRLATIRQHRAQMVVDCPSSDDSEHSAMFKS